MYLIKDTKAGEFLGICETTDIRTGLRSLKLVGAPSLDNIWKTESFEWAARKKMEMEEYFGWHQDELQIVEAELVIKTKLEQ